MVDSKRISETGYRRRKRRTTLFSFFGFAFLSSAVIAGIVFVTTRPVTLRIAIQTSDSTNANVIAAVAARFSNDRDPVRLSIIDTKSASDSLAALTSSKADIVVVRSDVDLPGDSRALAVLRKDVVVLWAPGPARKVGAKARIQNIGDLSGRRVGLVGRSEQDLKLLKLVLSESGIAPENVKVSQFGAEEIVRLARDPELDAFALVAPFSSRIASDAVQLTTSGKGEPVFLSIDASETLAQKHPALKSVTIPKQAFAARPARPRDEIETLGVDHLFVVSRSFSDTHASAFTRQLLSARHDLARDIPDAARIEKPDTDKDAPLPAHPGAAAYVDGTEQTFLERYSDYFWAAILVLSILGSAGAWIGHYLKHDERDLNVVHRDRLLGVISLVCQASSEADLAALQTDIDVVLRETLDCYDDGAIDEGGLMALSLVLDRLHGAIVDKRVAWSFVSSVQEAVGSPDPQVGRPGVTDSRAPGRLAAVNLVDQS